MRGKIFSPSLTGGGRGGDDRAQHLEAVLAVDEDRRVEVRDELLDGLLARVRGDALLLLPLARDQPHLQVDDVEDAHGLNPTCKK